MKKQERGIYILILKLKENQRISVGKLPETAFKPGIYFYIGRARRRLQARIKRHLRKEKKPFWHIDYLLQQAKIEEIWTKQDFFDECQTVYEINHLLKEPYFPLKKFGSSDCRCTSHLLFLPERKINLKALRDKISFEKVNIHGN